MTDEPSVITKTGDPLADLPQEGEGEPENLEAEFTGAYDDETDTYQVTVTMPGIVVAVHVQPEGFDLVDVLLASMPAAVAEVVEKIAEAREGTLGDDERYIPTTIADEETP